jgi:hypothetical protein
MENGEWWMVDGGWRMVDGEWWIKDMGFRFDFLLTEN